jgi:hypothetical protein
MKQLGVIIPAGVLILCFAACAGASSTANKNSPPISGERLVQVVDNATTRGGFTVTGPVSGGLNTVARHWKNGREIPLSDGNSKVYANAIAINGNDVYVAGAEENAASNRVLCYWKNGVKTTLTQTGAIRDRVSAIVLGGE